MPAPVLGAASSLLSGLGAVASPLAGMFGGSDGPSSAQTGPVSFGDVNVNTKAQTSKWLPWLVGGVVVLGGLFVLARNRSR